VSAVESVVADRRSQHEAVAAPYLREALERAGIDASGRVLVNRSRNGLTVTLQVPAETPDTVRAQASVRIVGALRAYDTAAPQIDVAVEDLAD